MEKHDKIYTPCDENDSALFAAWGEEAADYVGAIQEKENVIVLSPEELKEMWDMAKASPDYPGVFELFLKSKGIIL